MVETSAEKIKKGPFPQYPEGADMPGVVTASGRLALRRRLIRLPGGFKLTVRLPEYVNRLSHESKIKLNLQLNLEEDSSTEKNTQASLRPKALKRVREEILQKVKSSPKPDTETRKALIVEGQERDRFAEEFISSQQEVRVDMGELGEQMARFVVLNPLEGRKTEETDSKPPIFLISGISNDLESMGMLPQEIAFKGRKVVTIAYPESWHGNATDAFGKAMEESPNYEPHTSFFKEAIEKIRTMPDVKEKLGDSLEIELWGFSAGAAMVTEILEDPNFREIVSNAVIIAPPSCVDQKNLKIFNQEIPVPGDMLIEIKRTYEDLENVPKINVNNRREIEYTMDKRRRMLRTYNALRNKVLKRNEWWKKDMRVKDGGSIVVVSYDKDRLTKSYKAVNEIKQNPNLRVLELSGSHNTPRTKSEELITAINAVINSHAT